MPRMIHCAKLGQELPGLEEPPFPGELGERIFNEISQAAYEQWQQYATLLINHNGLSLGNPQHRDWLMEQMEDFFFGQGAEAIEGWVPPGMGGKGGAPAAKGGAPAPRRK